MATARIAARAVLALGAGAALVLGGGAAALAVPRDVEPSPGATQYPPPGEPTITARIFEPVCDGDVPYLRYEIEVTGTPNDTATMTWINPAGDDVVYADLPLSGRVLWPGAVVDGDGDPLDWPGWHLEGDEWVEGDEFDWVRPSVDVKLEVNPELTLTTAYPPSSPSCATNPEGNPDPSPGPSEPATAVSNQLPATGATVGRVATAAGALVVAGGLIVAVRAVLRRRRA